MVVSGHREGESCNQAHRLPNYKLVVYQTEEEEAKDNKAARLDREQATNGSVLDLLRGLQTDAGWTWKRNAKRKLNRRFLRDVTMQVAAGQIRGFAVFSEGFRFIGDGQRAHNRGKSLLTENYNNGWLMQVQADVAKDWQGWMWIELGFAIVFVFEMIIKLVAFRCVTICYSHTFAECAVAAARGSGRICGMSLILRFQPHAIHCVQPNVNCVCCRWLPYQQLSWG